MWKSIVEGGYGDPGGARGWEGCCGWEYRFHGRAFGGRCESGFGSFGRFIDLRVH
jgi:hypothetical protein